MSTHYNPRIVTTGLVGFWDASNTKSYPGSGTTWKDLSGNGYNATMYGTVPFSTDVAPCFDFSAASGAASASSSLGFTFASNMVTTTGNFTFSCWVKGISANWGQSGLFSNAGSSSGYRFGVNNVNMYYLCGNGASYTESTISFLSTLSSTQWYNVVGVYSRSTGQVFAYLNGIYQGVGSIPVDSTAFSTAAPGLIRSPCCTIVNHKVAYFSVHNTALSSAQVSQNFNALRGRFGI